MATFDFEQFVNSVKERVMNLAKTEASDFAEKARQDGEAFLESTKSDLLIWTRQLADGVLSRDEFEFLVKGKKDVAEMKALTQAGLGAAKVEKIRDGLIAAVLDAALSKL